MAILVFGMMKDINRHSDTSGDTVITMKIADVNSNRIADIDLGPYSNLGLGALSTAIKDSIKAWTQTNWGITWQALDTVRLFTGITDI